MATVTRQAILATAWLSEEESESYWLEGQPVQLQVERTEDGQVRIGVHRDITESEDAGLYMSDTEALRLMAAIGAAVHARLPD